MTVVATPVVAPEGAVSEASLRGALPIPIPSGAAHSATGARSAGARCRQGSPATRVRQANVDGASGISDVSAGRRGRAARLEKVAVTNSSGVAMRRFATSRDLNRTLPISHDWSFVSRAVCSIASCGGLGREPSRRRNKGGAEPPWGHVDAEAPVSWGDPIVGGRAHASRAPKYDDSNRSETRLIVRWSAACEDTMIVAGTSGQRSRITCQALSESAGEPNPTLHQGRDETLGRAQRHARTAPRAPRCLRAQ